MKNTKLLKTLLTILTIILVIVIPIWIGPEKMANDELCLFCEWLFGLIKLLGIVVVGMIIYWVFFIIYDLWDDIVDKFKN